MTFVPLCVLDVFDLIASLPRRLPLFRETEPGVRALVCRRPRQNSTEDACDFSWLNRDKHPELVKWPELRNQVEHIRTIGPQHGGTHAFDVGHVVFQQIGPNKTLPWAEPLSGLYAERVVRGVLALRTGPGATLFARTGAYCPAAGQLVIVPHRVETSAANCNLWPFIYLTIDLIRKPDEQLLDRGQDETA